MEKMKIKHVKELDSDHLRSIHGGGLLGAVAAGIAIAAAAEIISDWDNFKRGLQDKPEV